MNKRQQQVIEYLVEENRVLREQIGNHKSDSTRSHSVILNTIGDPVAQTVLRPRDLLRRLPGW
jgi:hypothetical protein